MRASPATPLRQLSWAAGIIGFALSGFFDGILLHQVLQWHHLFSLVPGEAWRDIRNQILVDGLFHVLMYVIASAGLVRLWRIRDQLHHPGAGRQVIAGALIGFGLWNVVDVVGFHWFLGIHRIRVGVPDPLVYDLGWLAALAFPFLVAGWWLLRRARDGGPHGGLAAALLALLTPVAATVAAVPSPNGKTALALFAPGLTPRAAFDAAAAADARVLWIDRTSGLAAFVSDRPLATRQLRSHGALFVSQSAAVAGCLAWAVA